MGLIIKASYVPTAQSRAGSGLSGGGHVGAATAASSHPALLQRLGFVFGTGSGGGCHPPVLVPSYCKATCCPPLRASVSPPEARAPHGHPQPRIAPMRMRPQPPLPQGPPKSIRHQTRHPAWLQRYWV